VADIDFVPPFWTLPREDSEDDDEKGKGLRGRRITQLSGGLFYQIVHRGELGEVPQGSDVISHQRLHCPGRKDALKLKRTKKRRGKY